MNRTYEFDPRGSAVALLAPILSAALFAAISIGIDASSNQNIQFLSAQYLFKTSLTAAAGAIFSAALVAARFVILSARSAERGYLQIPWPTDSKSQAAQEVKMNVIRSVKELFVVVDSIIEKGVPEELALKMIYVQLEEQRENFTNHQRIQFITPSLQSSALKDDAFAVESLRPDGYGLVVAAARKGDLVQATDFQNSRYWWLDRKVAFEFFEMNLQLVRRGVRIERIFGRNHSIWKEDEAGAKSAVIELQAKIKGIDVFSIDYGDFDIPKGFDIQAIDQLALVRNGIMLPSIEWKVDVQGATDKVFYVFGQGRLREMHENVFRMKNSSERGSTFRHHKVKKEFDVNRDDGYERAKREFAKIANSIA